MTKGGQVLRALSPKRKGSIGHKAEASGTSATARAGSRTLFARHKRRHSEVQHLPDTEKTDEEFQRDWGITKEEEERRLVDFRQAIEEAVGPLRPFYDKYYLRRFLRARSHDIPKAKEMFLKHLEWRKANGIDTILQDFVFEERDAFLTLYPQGYHKTDKLGRPIYVQHLGQINAKALYELTTEDRMLKFHVQEYERALKYIFPACSKVAGRHISQTLTILDLQGVGLRHLTGDVKRIISLITRMDQDNYPETLGKTLIINAPSFFKIIWGLVKPMLDVRTQAKIEVCSSNYMPSLLKWVDAESIPEYLGGKSKGSLLDDVGPWKDPKLVAEIDADIWRRDHSSQQEGEGERESCAESPLGPPEQLGPELLLAHTEATGGAPPHDHLVSSGSEEEFHEVKSRRHSLLSAGSSSYLSADEEFFTPKTATDGVASTPAHAAAGAAAGAGAEGGPSSFSSERPLILGRGSPSPSPFPPPRPRPSLGSALAAAAAPAAAPAPPEPGLPPLSATPASTSTPGSASAAVVAAQARSQAAAAAMASSIRAAVHKQHVAAEELIPSPPLQIPILARVRALEERLPSVERPIRRYLPPGEPPSKSVGEGTLLSRVAALERAMDALLSAQDSALNEAKRRAEQQKAERTCCSCCTVM